MFSHIRAQCVLLFGSLLLCSVLYPALVLAIGQGVFPHSANGSLIDGPDGKPVGSRLIAQEFKGERCFHPRPSAALYKADASSGSNFGASNPKLRARVEEQLKAEYDGQADVAIDAVTASGSGLDPHLTVRSAGIQAARVAASRGIDPARVKELIARQSRAPLSGLAGEPLVNVLELNLMLDRELSK